MSESLGNDHNDEIREQVHEEFSMTLARIQFFLEDRGVLFMPSEATRTESEHDPSYLEQVQKVVAEREKALGRMLDGDELTEVMDYYYAKIAEEQQRLEQMAHNSLKIIDLTIKIMSYWAFIRNDSPEAASEAKRELYLYIKESGLSDTWYELLDAEFAV